MPLNSVLTAEGYSVAPITPASSGGQVGLIGSDAARIRLRASVRKAQAGSAASCAGVFIGDSNTTPQNTGTAGASDLRNGLLPYLRLELISRGIPANYSSYLGDHLIGSAAGISAASPDITAAGGAALTSGSADMAGRMFRVSAAGHIWVFPMREPVDTIQVRYRGGTGWSNATVELLDAGDVAQSCTYVSNAGGSAAGVGTTATLHTVTNQAGSFLGVATFSVAKAAVKVRVTFTGAGAGFEFNVEGYDASSNPVRLLNCGRNGATTATFAVASSNSNHRGLFTQLGSALGFVVVNLGINNWRAGVLTPIETYQAELDSIVASVPAGVGVLVVNSTPTPDANEAAGLREPYTQAQRNVASKYDAVHLDLRKAYGDSWTPLSPLGWQFDTLHPLRWPYRDMAVKTADALLGT